jgi:hypothetical protein
LRLPRGIGVHGWAAGLEGHDRQGAGGDQTHEEHRDGTGAIENAFKTCERHDRNPLSELAFSIALRGEPKRFISPCAPQWQRLFDLNDA